VRKALAFFLALAGVVIFSRAEAADPTANDCVTLLRSTHELGVSFEAVNKCDRPLACAMSWTVQCESASGKITYRGRSEAKFPLASDESHETFASAEKCTSSWDIADVSWSCVKK